MNEADGRDTRRLVYIKISSFLNQIEKAKAISLINPVIPAK